MQERMALRSGPVADFSAINYINIHFPGAVGAVDHGGFNIGGFAGAGDKGHAVGQALYGKVGVKV